MNAAVTQEERNRFLAPLPIRKWHLLRQVMKIATVTLAMSTIGWTKARGRASSRARVTTSKTREREQWRRWGRDNHW